MKRMLLGLTLALLVIGCGGGKARVKGRVVDNGQPMTFPPTTAAIELTPIGADGKPDVSAVFTAVVNEDGTFEVFASGGELPPGQYEIKVTGYGKLATRLKAVPALRRELKGGTNDLTIDLSKPEG
jgi:hypothetical protein